MDCEEFLSGIEAHASGDLHARGPDESGLPQQGLPQQGLPKQGLPKQGLPKQGLPKHCRECPDCARKFRRARLVVSVLRGLPEEAGATDTTGAATILAASAILDRRADARKAVVRHLLRTAAVLLLLVGLATAFGKLLLGRPAYRPLDLEFVQVSPNDEPDTEIPLEEIFGPTTPLLSANGGHGGERSNR